MTTTPEERRAALDWAESVVGDRIEYTDHDLLIARVLVHTATTFREQLRPVYAAALSIWDLDETYHHDAFKALKPVVLKAKLAEAEKRRAG